MDGWMDRYPLLLVSGLVTDPAYTARVYVLPSPPPFLDSLESVTQAGHWGEGQASLYLERYRCPLFGLD